VADGGTARGDRAERTERGRAPGAAFADLESVVAEAVARLAAAAGCPRVAVLAADGTEDPDALRILGATPEARAACGSALTAASTRRLAGRFEGDAAPRDLGAGPAPADAALLDAFAAAAPVAAAAGTRAWLLAGGPDDPPGRVRPRTLAALATAAERLTAPVRASAAAARLAALDERVRRMDALAAVGELAAELVHEVRNPLVSVKTFLQLLPEHADDPEFRSHFLEVVGGEVHRMERLLDAALAQAGAAGPPAAGEPAAVGEVLTSVARLLAHRARERGVTLETDAPPDATVPLDADALRQVVLNLALNALDAAPAGGAVRIAAGAGREGAWLVCDDTGPGIPPDRREHVFEPFFSGREGRPGGLGLAIARRLVVGSGGRIGVADREGGGARIHLDWPAADSRQPGGG